MPPSLPDLPFEVRCNIYRYLLVDEHVSETKEEPSSHSEVYGPLGGRNVLRPEFCTALFRVSKEILSETVSFFHTQNKFVMFRTPWLSLYRQGLPMYPSLEAAEGSSESCSLPEVLLDMKISPSRDPTEQVSMHEGTRLRIYIFSLKHLPMFARLLYHIKDGWRSFNHLANWNYLHFGLRLKSSYCSVRPSAIQTVLLEAAKEFGKGPSRCPPSPSDPFFLSKIDKKLISCFSGDFEADLGTFMQQTMADQELVTLLDDARFWIEHGNRSRDSWAFDKMGYGYSKASTVLFHAWEHCPGINWKVPVFSTAEKREVARMRNALGIEWVRSYSMRGHYCGALREIRRMSDFVPGFDQTLKKPLSVENVGLILLNALFLRQDGYLHGAQVLLNVTRDQLPATPTALLDDFEEARADIEGPRDGAFTMALVMKMLTSVDPESKHFDSCEALKQQ